MASTKKSLTARVAAGIGAVALATLTAFGASLPASAAENNIDPERDRSLTIHKFAEPATPTGASNNGSQITDLTVLENLTPLHGVEFTMQQVPGINLTAAADWETASKMPIDDAIAAVADGSPYERTGTTDEDGQLVFSDNVPMGLFLVTETAAGVDAEGNPNVIAFETQPFLVTLPLPVENQWIYEAHVYPKNALTDITKELDDDAARGLGDTVTWTIRNLVPHTAEGNSVESYVITDRLDERLRYTGAVVSISDITLVENRDYTIKVDNGLVRVAATPEALGMIKAGGGETLSIVISTEVVSIGDGFITNEATLFINDVEMERGFVSNEQISYWGAVRIVKHATGDEQALLDGAIFEVRDAAGQLVEVDGETRFTTVDGEVVIPGLRTSAGAGDTYSIVEVVAPTGYVLDETPHPVTVVAGSLTQAKVVTVVNAQVPAYALPITGGSGQAAFMIGGFGLLAGALGFMLMRRRKAKADAQA